MQQALQGVVQPAAVVRRIDGKAPKKVQRQTKPKDPKTLKPWLNRLPGGIIREAPYGSSFPLCLDPSSLCRGKLVNDDRSLQISI